MRRALPTLFAVILVVPAAFATLAPDVDEEPAVAPSTAPPGAGTLDPWLDAAGDTLFGNLDAGTNGIVLRGTLLSSPTAGVLRFGAKTVCLDQTTCQGPPGLTGAAGPVGPQGPAGTLSPFDCGSGKLLRAVNATGVPVCATDADTVYAAGTGLTQTGTVFSANTNVVQSRVSSACAAGSAIRAIDAAGAVTCEADDAGGSWTAGAGIAIAGNSIGLSSSGCVAGEVWKFDGSAWGCVIDANNVYSASGALLLSGTTFAVAVGGIDSLYLEDGGIATADLANAAITTPKLKPTVLAVNNSSMPLTFDISPTDNAPPCRLPSYTAGTNERAILTVEASWTNQTSEETGGLVVIWSNNGGATWTSAFDNAMYATVHPGEYVHSSMTRTFTLNAGSSYVFALSGRSVTGGHDTIATCYMTAIIVAR